MVVNLSWYTNVAKTYWNKNLGEVVPKIDGTTIIDRLKRVESFYTDKAMDVINVKVVFPDKKLNELKSVNI